AYVGVRFIAEVVKKAGNTNPDAFREAAEGFQLTTPRDLPGRPSWIRPLDHQIVQDIYIGTTVPDSRYEPAKVMLGNWTVIDAERVLPTEAEVQRLRRLAIRL